jgi:TonB family protein
MASPQKVVDKTLAPPSKAKAVSTHATSEPDKVPAKSEVPVAAASTPTTTPASTPVASQPTASQPAAKTPPPPVAPKRLRVDAPQQLAKLVDRVNPTYPLLARQTQISGAVQMNIVVGKDGRVLSVTPVSGDALLLQSASDAVKQWRYQPTLVNGEPVEVETTVEVDYKLNAAPAAPAKAVACTLGSVEFQDQGTMLIGKVPYSYAGASGLQSLAVRGVPLNASKQPIAATIAQSTLKSASGTASFSVESHPALGKAGTDGEYILVAIVVKSTSEVVCGEAVPFRHKW